MAGRTFADLPALNIQARAFCDKVNATPKRHLHASPRELFAAERPHLRPLPLFVPEVYALHHRLVDVEGFVNVHGHRYSVPYLLIGRQLEIRETKDRLDVYHGPRLVASHAKVLGRTFTRVTVPEHRPPRGARLSTQPLPEEQTLAQADPPVPAYAAALKHRSAGRGGGRIRIGVTTEDGMATVTVADTGVGIPPEMLPRIFDLFTQLEPFRDRTHGGLGIGLTLVKRLVELHGGSVEARSEGRGRGSAFVVRLPLAAGPPKPAARGDAGYTARRGCRILVAEDDADAAEMLRVMLTFMGQEVRVAADGAEAIAVALAFEPQIALLDIGMPRVDGFEAARRIRELLGDRVVIVAVTGWGQDEDKRLAREAGFDYHLTKPAEPGMLERLISECGTPRGEP